MSDNEETYCRLCAEPTPIVQLISADDEVGLNSKISTKMMWINVDLSKSNNLPKTICFSCFDLLERTWLFLHEVRSAQQKLQTIFDKKCDEIEAVEGAEEVKSEEIRSGKPVDKNWEDFEEIKPDIKLEDTNIHNAIIVNLDTITTVDPSTLIDINFDTVKAEHISDVEENNFTAADPGNSTDSDLPLQFALKKKKLKKKKKIKNKQRINTDYNDIKEPVDVSTLSLTWDDFMCRCAYCDALCKNISSLRLHARQIHSSCCIFKCSDCGKVVSNYRSFVNHVRIHQQLLKYCCEICNKMFTMLEYIRKHRNLEHRDTDMLMCPNCGAIFESEEQVQDHMLLYTKSYKKKNRDKLGNDLKCDLCNKEFKSRSNLQQHKLVHTERSRDFSCHVCGKMFFTKGSLSTHILTHEDTKPFKCEFCPLTFRARGNLRSHASLHSGAKPFVCEQCGKSFRVKRHLKSHSIVHTDLMPYVCEFCNKSFRFKTRLNLHLRQHTGAKPYRCIYCQRDFTNGSNYKKHMKRRHDVDTSRRRFNNIVEGLVEVNNEDNA